MLDLACDLKPGSTWWLLRPQPNQSFQELDHCRYWDEGRVVDVNACTGALTVQCGDGDARTEVVQQNSTSESREALLEQALNNLR